MNFSFRKTEPGWVPYIWLAYLTFFLWGPIVGHIGGREWTLTALGLVAFLCFYFSFFSTCKPWNLICVGGIASLGVLFAPFNEGAACFFIYACSMVPFAVDTELAAAVAIATLVGSASMLPGGLGVADASIAGLLLAVVASPLMTRDVAVAASLLIRFATLWFGVLIGACVLLLNHRRFGALPEFASPGASAPPEGYPAHETGNS